MIKKLTLTLLILMTVMVLSACGGDGESSAATETGSGSGSDTIAEVRVNENGQITEQEQESDADEVMLSNSFDDALSLEGQLVIGSVQLDDTEKAIDADQAAKLLPLWQAYQSLSSSDTTAAAELNAVLDQIQDTMTVDQIAAIADMQLTNEALTELMEEGELAFGRGGYRGLRGSGEEGQEGGTAGGYQGGIPGQGPGGGGYGGGLPGGGPGGYGSFSEDDIATRQAQFEGGDLGDFQGRFLTGIIIRLLQDKTGEAPEIGGAFTTIYGVIAAEIGLTVEEIQEQLADEKTLAEIIESNGGDMEVIQEKLLEVLDGSDQFRGQDLEEFLGSIFN